MLYFNVLSELPLADEFGARMELEVKILILFLNEDKQILFCKEKSLLKINDDDIFRELNKFKRYVENYCGIQESSAEQGLGPNIAVKLAKSKMLKVLNRFVSTLNCSGITKEVN
jgi:hypothetical protein